MTYKTIPTMNKKNPDSFSRSGNIITINDTDYDLENPQPLPEIGKDEHDNPILESCENQRVFLTGDICSVRLYPGFLQFFLFQDKNNMLFHDHDADGELDLVEYLDFLDCLILPDRDSKAEHKLYLIEYMTADIPGKNKSEAVEYLNQNPIYGHTREECIAKNLISGISEELKKEILNGLDKWVYKRIKTGAQLKKYDKEHGSALRDRLGIVK